MPDCDELIDHFYRQSRDQVDLALAAEQPAVAAMHIDLALFSTAQAQYAEDICEDEVAEL